MDNYPMNYIIKKQKIEKAVLDGKWLKFDYVDSKMEITRRIVEPISVEHWGVYGRDIMKDAPRQFQYDGIQKLQVVDKGEVHVKAV